MYGVIRHIQLPFPLLDDSNVVIIFCLVDHHYVGYDCRFVASGSLVPASLAHLLARLSITVLLAASKQKEWLEHFSVCVCVRFG